MKLGKIRRRVRIICVAGSHFGPWKLGPGATNYRRVIDPRTYFTGSGSIPAVQRLSQKSRVLQDTGAFSCCVCLCPEADALITPLIFEDSRRVHEDIFILRLILVDENSETLY
jgi:hypothetical protein